MSTDVTPDVDAIADWLGAMDESKNHFDYTDEATTWINIPVETLAERIAERLGGRTLQPGIPRPTKAEAELERLREGVRALADEWYGYGHGEFNIHLEEHLPCSACDLLATIRSALDGDQGSGLLDEDGGA